MIKLEIALDQEGFQLRHPRIIDALDFATRQEVICDVVTLNELHVDFLALVIVVDATQDDLGCLGTGESLFDQATQRTNFQTHGSN